jgi:hypothetical protein
MLYCMTADVDWQCDLRNFCCVVICRRVDDLTPNYLRQLRMFVCLFVYLTAVTTLQIIYRRMRNGNVIIVSELVKSV